jgi:hypothetical protein
MVLKGRGRTVRLPQQHTGAGHRAIHVHLRTGEGKSNYIVWKCDTDDFEILSIKPDKNNKAEAPKNPFRRSFGNGQAKGKKGGSVNSGLLRDDVVDNAEYKFSYRVGNKTYDPHIITHR